MNYADRYWIGAIAPSGETFSVWDGTGRIANEHGDLFGNAPHRVVRAGYVSIAADRTAAAVAAGWRLRAQQPEDPDFARLERGESERT